MDQNLIKLLLYKGMLVDYKNNTKIKKPTKKQIYYGAYLINKFGISVDRVDLLTEKNLKDISYFFDEKVPSSFYDNPQDLKYYSCSELIIEQYVLYYNISGNEFSNNEKLFNRDEIFSKLLPKRTKGEEIVLRKYEIINNEKMLTVFRDYYNNLLSFTRSWSGSDKNRFISLEKFLNIKSYDIKSRDNIMAMFKYTMDVNYAKLLDKKDVVKLSINIFGENKKLSKDLAILDRDIINIFKNLINNVNDCPLTKKQYKFYTRLEKIFLGEIKTRVKIDTIYVGFQKLMNESKYLQAAKYLSKNKSILSRNMVYIISRLDNLNDIREVLGIYDIDNPVVALQLYQTIILNNNKNRIFQFVKNGYMKMHIEKDEESNKRKSVLDNFKKENLKYCLGKKLEEYYKNKKIGNVYIEQEFKNIALPFNNSSTNEGILVYPTGSRIKIEDDYIRTFCYWNEIYDVDASCLLMKENNKIYNLYWGTYSLKPFGNAAFSSGDARGKKGAEYQDFKIKELIEQGFTNLIYVLNGYAEPLNRGNVYAGYQNKKDLNTKAWDPNNIAFEIKVFSEKNSSLIFGIDLINKEIVILNINENSSSLVADRCTYYLASKFMSKDFLKELNVFEFIKFRANRIVEDPKEAEVLFIMNKNSLENINVENKEIIYPYDLEKLINLI